MKLRPLSMTAAALCISLPALANPPQPAPTRIDHLVLGGLVDASGAESVIVPDATAANQALNRQTGDARYVRAASDPVFWLVNQESGIWTDFEIKGHLDGNRVYYYHSSDPDGRPGQQWGGAAEDVPPDVWFTDSRHTSVLEWRKQSTDSSIHAMRADASDSVVGGWVIAVRDLQVDAADIVRVRWSFVWMSGLDFDRDGGGAGNQLWRPIAPAQMVSESWMP